jgi:diguanylate cyclase (GGDEF)-like protein
VLVLGSFQKNDPKLWVMTGLASIPFAAVAFLNKDLLILPNLIYLFIFAIIFNGYIVPFLLFKDSSSYLKRALALGGNLVIASLWINYTGNVDSIFFPSFFLIPIIAATIYGGLYDSLLTAAASSIFTISYILQNEISLIKHPSILVTFILFFLISAVLGYLVNSEREQKERTGKMKVELEVAYNQLTATHQKLQSYTETIQKMNREMELLAITDELTGLYNYRYFQITLDQLLKQNKKSYLTIIMLDIDYFKNYNDVYGHIMGNKILAEIANIIKEYLPEDYKVFRYGGEEFSMVLPGADTNQAIKISEQVRKEIAKMNFCTLDGVVTQVTVSMGIATFPVNAKNKSELISKADIALYEAKQTGRNKVCLFKEKIA